MRHFALLILLVALHPLQAAEIYRRVDPALLVPSLLQKVNPKGLVIPPSSYRETEKGVYEVTLPPDANLPETVYLEARASWVFVAPVSSAPPAAAPAQTLRITRLNGPVSLQSGGSSTAVTEGQEIPPGATLQTGPDGTAALSSPAVSAVLGPRSIMQPASTSDLRLHNGTLIARPLPGAAPGSFTLRTPNMVAAARGTNYLVWHENNLSVACIVEGHIDVRKTDDSPVADLLVTASSGLLFQAVPDLSGKEYAEWLHKMTRIFDETNGRLSAANATSFTCYLPVIRKNGTLKSSWDSVPDGRIRW